MLAVGGGSGFRSRHAPAPVRSESWERSMRKMGALLLLHIIHQRLKILYLDMWKLSIGSQSLLTPIGACFNQKESSSEIQY